MLQSTSDYYILFVPLLLLGLSLGLGMLWWNFRQSVHLHFLAGGFCMFSWHSTFYPKPDPYTGAKLPLFLFAHLIFNDLYHLYTVRISTI